MHIDFLHSMRYHATHKPVWRNGIRACLKNKSPQGVEGSNLSTGIARPRVGCVAKIFKPIKKDYILQLNKGKTGKRCTRFL
jgi:hypothetical protein